MEMAMRPRELIMIEIRRPTSLTRRAIIADDSTVDGGIVRLALAILRTGIW